MPNKKPTPGRILYEALPKIPVAAKEVLADILQAAADQMREDKDTIDTLQRRVAELEALREAIEGQAAQDPKSISIRVRYQLNKCKPKG